MTEISCSRVGCGTKCCMKCPTEEEDGFGLGNKNIEGLQKGYLYNKRAYT